MTERSCYRKIGMSICLLAIGILLSIGVAGYKSEGAFLNGKRKLPIYCVDTKEKKVAITFDASWGEDKTNEILEILDKYNVKATFFVVGGWVDQHAIELKEMVKRGHEIGNHSNNHPMVDKISKEKIIKDMEICDAKIMKVTGKSTTLYRCPSGAYNNLALEAIESTGRYCIQWDVDSIDWKANGADIEYNRVISKTKPGSILLFHNDAKYTPQTLPRIIEALKEKGYSFVKVSELIYKDNYYIDPTGKQIQN